MLCIKQLPEISVVNKQAYCQRSERVILRNYEKVQILDENLYQSRIDHYRPICFSAIRDLQRDLVDLSNNHP